MRVKNNWGRHLTSEGDTLEGEGERYGKERKRERERERKEVLEVVFLRNSPRIPKRDRRQSGGAKWVVIESSGEKTEEE